MICPTSLPCSSRCWGYFKETPEKCPPSSCWQLHHRWKHPKTGRQVPQKIPTRRFSLPVFPPLYFPTITQTCESPAREIPVLEHPRAPLPSPNSSSGVRQTLLLFASLRTQFLPFSPHSSGGCCPYPCARGRWWLFPSVPARLGSLRTFPGGISGANVTAAPSCAGRAAEAAGAAGAVGAG